MVSDFTLWIKRKSSILHNGGMLILLSAFLFLAYSNSFQVPFLYDDRGSIEANPSIRSVLGSLKPVFYGIESVTGRPVLNFTLALNYNWGGLKVWGYHLVNLLIHLSVGILLYCLLNRTLKRQGFWNSFQQDSKWVAGSVVLVWALHPLQVESVTYIVVRSESLVSLFYVGTLYCSLCSWDSNRPHFWKMLSVILCWCGMGAKEVMVTAPVVVILYDSVFSGLKFLKLWERKRFYYYGLFSSWIFLAYLVVMSEGRGDAVGFSGAIGLEDYVKTQFWALTQYLRLALWPDSLVFDYGIMTVTSPERVIPCALIVISLIAVILWGLWKDPKWGFWGIWSILLLLPTSSVVPIHSEPISEHRFYLALFPVILYLVAGGYRIIGRWIFIMVLILSIVLGNRTYVRNQDYQSVESIWRDTVMKVPQNARAHNNYAGELYRKGDPQEAEKHLREAIRYQPDQLNAYLNYAMICEEQNRFVEAEKMAREAIRVNDRSSEAWGSLGSILMKSGENHKAYEAYEKALSLNSKNLQARLGLVLFAHEEGEWEKCIKIYRELIQEYPQQISFYSDLGRILEERKRFKEAESVYLQALQIDQENALILKRLESIQPNLPAD